MTRPDTAPTRIAVIGYGDIGRRHIAAISEVPTAVVSAVVEPGPLAERARESGVPVYPDIEAMFAAGLPDGCILATPNSTHYRLALACIERGVPVLVEKPITDNVADGYRLADAAESAGVPVLVGHHRRHSAIVQEARRIVQSGVLGDLTAIQAAFMVRKPDDYYEVSWRREPGGGPILINLIHDIDNLRYIAGEIVSVQGVVSSARRGNPVEDTAAAIVEFAGGAIGTFTISDAASSPWSWELTSGEHSSYVFARYDTDCYHFAGTNGSLAVPSLRTWLAVTPDGWLGTMPEARSRIDPVDPARQQIAHFVEVIRGAATPVVTARDAARTLEVTMAVAESARSEAPVALPLR